MVLSSFVYICLFIWLHWVLDAACDIFSYGMWDLVPRAGIEPKALASGAQSLSHWTIREVLVLSSYHHLQCPNQLTPPQQAFLISKACFGGQGLGYRTVLLGRLGDEEDSQPLRELHGPCWKGGLEQTLQDELSCLLTWLLCQPAV